ncbi:MAG: hypothetical protein C0434_08000 [Xanthomonadaceae bacterium]|nr:hypothetical protein [Xanthomonadaceae bacterium]
MKAAIQLMNQALAALRAETASREASLAITNLEQAQMWAERAAMASEPKPEVPLPEVMGYESWYDASSPQLMIAARFISGRRHKVSSDRFAHEYRDQRALVARCLLHLQERERDALMAEGCK